MAGKLNYLVGHLRIYVGTSGWLYDWNLGRNFDWYLENSKLNAVELNASFYRFPFPNQVKSWARKGKKLRWAIKVNRLVTHVFRYNERAINTWKKFKRLFDPLDGLIDFYLFQLPPKYTPKAAGTLERFIRVTKLRERFAREVRNEAWFKHEWIEWARKLGITWVSVDCPDFPREVYNTSGLVYERVHGRTAWYSHYYTDAELEEIVARIQRAKPRKAYAFFNNDHDMLENAQRMLALMKK
jgi:uncharacterized protein YecE (DUF72 family)